MFWNSRWMFWVSGSPRECESNQFLRKDGKAEPCLFDSLLFLKTSSLRNKPLTKHGQIKHVGGSRLLRRKLLKNRMMSSGLVLLVFGTFGTILGFAAFANYSEQCFVTPGGFPPCLSKYQVSLLAPLYPLSAGLVLLGLILGVLGSALTYVGYSKATSIVPDISTSEPTN